MRRLACAFLLACFCAPLWAATPATQWKAATAIYATGITADSWTSLRAFHNGYGELNPALPEYPTDSRFIAQTAIIGVGAWLLARRLHKTHPRAATWILVGLGSLHGAAAIHNARID